MALVPMPQTKRVHIPASGSASAAKTLLIRARCKKSWQGWRCSQEKKKTVLGADGSIDPVFLRRRRLFFVVLLLSTFFLLHLLLSLTKLMMMKKKKKAAPRISLRASGELRQGAPRATAPYAPVYRLGGWVGGWVGVHMWKCAHVVCKRARINDEDEHTHESGAVKEESQKKHGAQQERKERKERKEKRTPRKVVRHNNATTSLLLYFPLNSLSFLFSSRAFGLPSFHLMNPHCAQLDSYFHLLTSLPSRSRPHSLCRRAPAKNTAVVRGGGSGSKADGSTGC